MPRRTSRRWRGPRTALVAAWLLAIGLTAACAPGGAPPPVGADGLGAVTHLVVVYEENHSFDNLFGRWEGVDGVRGRGYRARSVQRAADGTVLPCLPLEDVNLASPPLPVTCRGTVDGRSVDSAFGNRPFLIDDHIAPTDRTCPQPGRRAGQGTARNSPGALPGGCTQDLVHRFYQEQWQIHGGRQDRYVAGSDAMGLAMGAYDTRRLPIYRYLHGPGAPRYAIADRFFQAAFGGSFLNHVWLISARTPVFAGAVRDGSPSDQHSVLGADGSPADYPLHRSSGLRDGALSQAANPDGSCAVPAGLAAPPRGTVCGDYAVNTLQPYFQPHDPTADDARLRLPPLTGPTIGDRLTDRGVSWAWYAGGWDNAAGNVGGPGWTNGRTVSRCADPQSRRSATWPNCPDKTFQFHHQPFAYVARYAPHTAAREAHLRDEVDFLAAARTGRLRQVSFVKPLGVHNEHPGYGSEHRGSAHLVELIRAVLAGPQAAHTAIVVTWDEFGGQWDHVPPPRGDRFGPGTRIPALVISPALPRAFTVDHTPYDTTSILATIERGFGLPPLGTRDRNAADLRTLISGR
jgi:phospholipase C